MSPGCASGPEQQRYRGLQLGGGSHHHALPDHQVRYLLLTTNVADPDPG
jgi:hypothetical protein